MNYLLHVLVMISIYSILALSLNLLVGYTGLLSLCHAAFYGVGAYASTLLVINLGFGFIPSLLLAMAAAAFLSFTISVPSLRLKGDYFVLASLGFQVIAFTVLYNWMSLTQGPFGISDIPRPEIFGVEISTLLSYVVFSGAIALICILLLSLVMRSPFGRVLKAIREDEIATAALGKNVFRFKITAFVIAAAFAAVSGGLFAGYVRYIDPLSFNLAESVFILSIIIIGGTGNIVGPLIGTVLMIVLPEALRFLQIPDIIAPNIRQIIYGGLILALMRYRPGGLRGEYRFE